MSRPDATLTWLRAWRGFTEGPDNANPFAALAHHAPNQPWCATERVAAHRCTGVAIPPGADSASAMTNYHAYARAGLLLDLTRDLPAMGDVFWLGAASAIGPANALGISHEGTVWERLRTTVFSSEEGNWGDRCASVVRDWTARGTSWVAGFARPRWDWSTPELLHLPEEKTSVTMLRAAIPAAAALSPAQAAAIYAGTPGSLAIDGDLGPATIRAWQKALGTSVDGTISHPSDLVRALQRTLNTAVGARLAVDGEGVAQDGRRYATVAALQAYLGCPRDGVLSTPSSGAVRALQRRLNTGSF